ncbi:uncharacterized protein LOC144350813 [Saccoglossus kowalevskii]
MDHTTMPAIIWFLFYCMTSRILSAYGQQNGGYDAQQHGSEAEEGGGLDPIVKIMIPVGIGGALLLLVFIQRYCTEEKPPNETQEEGENKHTSHGIVRGSQFTSTMSIDMETEECGSGMDD